MKINKKIKKLAILTLALVPIATVSLSSCSKKPIAYLPVSVSSNIPSGKSDGLSIPYNFIIKPTPQVDFYKASQIPEGSSTISQILVDYVNNGSSFALFYTNSFLKHACSTKDIGQDEKYSKFCKLLSNDSSVGNRSLMYSAYSIKIDSLDFIKSKWTKDNPYTYVEIKDIVVSYREYIADKNTPESSLSYIQSAEHKNPQNGYKLKINKSLIIRQKMKDSGDITQIENKEKYLESLDADNSNKFLFYNYDNSNLPSNSEFEEFKNVSLLYDKNHVQTFDIDLFKSTFNFPEKI